MTYLESDQHQAQNVENVGQVQPVVLELHSAAGVDQILGLALVMVAETGVRWQAFVDNIILGTASTTALELLRQMS